jgi:hypothetical protein
MTMGPLTLLLCKRIIRDPLVTRPINAKVRQAHVTQREDVRTLESLSKSLKCMIRGSTTTNIHECN